MKIDGYLVGEFIDGRDEAEEPGEERTDGKSSNAVPEEKHDDTAFGDGAFFPGDFRMEKISKNGGKSVRNDAV